jgi:hypothetical protein
MRSKGNDRLIMASLQHVREQPADDSCCHEYGNWGGKRMLRSGGAIHPPVVVDSAFCYSHGARGRDSKDLKVQDMVASCSKSRVSLHKLAPRWCGQLVRIEVRQQWVTEQELAQCARAVRTCA